MSSVETSLLSSSESYWRATRQPLANLLFVAPWILCYEAGVWLSGQAAAPAARNGADAWLRIWLSHAGWIASGLLPLVVLGALLAWHVALRRPWRVSWDTLGGMLAESLLFAFALILLGQSVDFAVRRGAVMQVAASLPTTPGWSLRLVSFLGAGIYEEFLFRLCLVPVGYLALRGLLVPHRWAIVGTVAASSVIFALAHYLAPQTDITALSLFADAVARVQSSRELWFGFGFRVAAGVFFAVLFCYRGFGIAVGCHAVYDVVVGIVLLSEL